MIDKSIISAGGKFKALTISTVTVQNLGKLSDVPLFETFKVYDIIMRDVTVINCSDIDSPAAVIFTGVLPIGDAVWTPNEYNFSNVDVTSTAFGVILIRP